MLHTGGKDDLGAGAAKLLQPVDKVVQLLGGGKQHLDQHAVVAGDAVALHHVGAAFDIGVKLRLALGVQFQVDERLDAVAQRRRVHLRLVAPQQARLLQPGNARRHRRGGQKHLLGDLLQRRAGVGL